MRLYTKTITSIYYCKKGSVALSTVIPFLQYNTRSYSTEPLSKTNITLPNNIKLRAYQQECIDTCLDHIAQGVRRIGVSMATGGGKTVIFANLIESFRQRFQEKFNITTKDDDSLTLKKKAKGTVLVMVHRRELAIQAEKTIKQFHPHLNVQIELGDSKTYMTLKGELSDLRMSHAGKSGAGPGTKIARKFNSNVQKINAKLQKVRGHPDVVICSVQSLIRRLGCYDPKEVMLIIIDEAHHAVAKSYLEILEYFNALKPPLVDKDEISSIISSATPYEPPVIGFSATFERQDKKALGQVMEKIVYDKGILEMIEDEWLCDAKFSTVQIASLDLSQVATNPSPKTSRTKTKENNLLEDEYGDFKVPQLSKVMNTPEINEIIVKTYLARREKIMNENMGHISTILFAVDIEHVHCLHEMFQKHGISTAFVTSLSKQHERDQHIEDFKNNKIEVILNCGIFTEGTDMPNINCILLCRPTKSRTLLVQMVGRGLRLHKNKQHCHVMDFVSSTKTTGIVSVPTLVGINDWQEILGEGEIEDFPYGDMRKEELSIQDLQKIKEKREMLRKQEQERQIVERENFNATLKEKYEQYINETGALDLTFTTFDSFSDFCASQKANEDSVSPFHQEYSHFRDSLIPWVNHTHNRWAYKIPKTTTHLSITKNNDSERHYVLKVLTEIPQYVRNTATSMMPKHNSKILLKSYSLGEIMAKAAEYLTHCPSCYVVKRSKFTSPHKQLTISKFAQWRKSSATDKQSQWIKKIAVQCMERSRSSSKQPVQDNLPTEQQVDHYLRAKLTKGEAQDLIFACSLSPQYPLRKFLRNVSYKLS